MYTCDWCGKEMTADDTVFVYNEEKEIGERSSEVCPECGDDDIVLIAED